MVQYSDSMVIEERGVLISYEAGKELPASMKRLVLIQNMPIGAIRGAHANMNGDCTIILVSGQVKITIHDNELGKKETLSTPGEYIFIPAKTWHKVESIQQNSSVCICASNKYEEAKYLSDYA